MTFYLIAQMVGAGVLIETLVGIDFSLAVIFTGMFMLCYVIFGGMVATTWVQIVKAVLLMAGILAMSIFVLGKVGFNPIELFNRAKANKTAEVDVLARRPAPTCRSRWTPSRSASRSCSARPACRTS